MTYFEYATLRKTDLPSELIVILNDLGEKGWELIAVDKGVYILKREKQR